MSWTCTCGQENEGNFCISCGSPAPAKNEAPAVVAVDENPVTNEAEVLSAESAVEEILEPVAPLVTESEVDPDDFKPVEPDHSAPISVPVEPTNKQSSYTNEAKSATSTSAPVENQPGKTEAMVALVLSIAGIIVPFIGTLLAIAGLVLAIVSKNKGYKGGIGTAAMVISIVSLVLSFLSSIGCILLIMTLGSFI